MSALKATRSAQWSYWSSFTYDISAGDTLANTAGAVVAIGFVVGAQAFDAIKLPKGAVVVGGNLVVEVVSNDAGTTTLSVGDSGSATRYLGATNVKAAAVTALVPTGYHGTGEDIRLTLANGSGGATTGKITVNVEFILDGKADAVFPN